MAQFSSPVPVGGFHLLTYLYSCKAFICALRATCPLCPNTRWMWRRWGAPAYPCHPARRAPALAHHTSLTCWQPGACFLHTLLKIPAMVVVLLLFVTELLVVSFFFLLLQLLVCNGFVSPITQWGSGFLCCAQLLLFCLNSPSHL